MWRWFLFSLFKKELERSNKKSNVCEKSNVCAKWEDKGKHHPHLNLDGGSTPPQHYHKPKNRNYHEILAIHTICSSVHTPPKGQVRQLWDWRNLLQPHPDQAGRQSCVLGIQLQHGGAVKPGTQVPEGRPSGCPAWVWELQALPQRWEQLGRHRPGAVSPGSIPFYFISYNPLNLYFMLYILPDGSVVSDNYYNENYEPSTKSVSFFGRS